MLCRSIDLSYGSKEEGEEGEEGERGDGFAVLKCQKERMSVCVCMGVWKE